MSKTQHNGSDFDLYYDYPSYNEYGADVVYDIFIYPGYPFERTVYTYIWGFLVLITFLANIIVIFVLLRKNMRNPTNLILIGIAIADSLTGLVTLPAYWAAYSKFEPKYSAPESTMTENTTGISGSNSTNSAIVLYSQEGYTLSKGVCTYFMVTKYFLSKSFHTVSIWLTLFLGFQRFISVALPFRSQTIFNKRNTVIICVVICLAAPLLHIYHLLDEKAVDSQGLCEWEIQNCKGDCAYLVIVFLFRHFLPCMFLVISTVLFVINLTKSSHRVSHLDSNKGNSSMRHRNRENRRVTTVVIAIVIVFLIPEVPYGCFLFYVLVVKFKNTGLNLETNRAIHLAYEVSLVVSFHLNIYIFTFFNERFRRTLLKHIIYPVLSVCGHRRTINLEPSSSTSSRRKPLRNDTFAHTEMTHSKVNQQGKDISHDSTINRKQINEFTEDNAVHTANDVTTEIIEKENTKLSIELENVN